MEPIATVSMLSDANHLPTVEAARALLREPMSQDAPTGLRDRLIVFSSAFLWASSLCATTSLGFDGDGYSISMEIGRDTEPVVASLNVRTPRAPSGVHLHGDFNTVAFDVQKRILFIEFVQRSAGQQPGSFTLDVKGEEAALRIDNKVITRPFGWFMQVVCATNNSFKPMPLRHTA